jgi:hypothetical protein
VTNLIGLRLAYRGFVTGLAAGYVWLATAMGIAALLDGDALTPLRPFAASVMAGDPSREAAFVLGFALVQMGSAVLGMLFSYFFGRFFTIRRTLAVAAPCFALLAWALLATLVSRGTGQADIGTSVAPLLATLAYGVLLGAALPVRGEVTRYPAPASSGSPVT